MSSFNKILAAIALLAGANLEVLRAQSQNARLVGRIVDTTAAAVPGATVTATHTATGVSRTAFTGETGDYVIENLIPGIYTVKAQLTGFKTQEQQGIRLEVNQRGRLDLTLVPGDLAETVTVTGQSPILDSETAEMGQVVSERLIQDLPLNGRNIFQLARYTTGGILASPASVNVQEERQGMGLPAFNGQDFLANSFLSDGADNQDYYQNSVTTRPVPDAVQEFKIVTNNYSPEYGRVGGAVITLVSKAGTNQFHGSAWEYLRKR